MFRTIARFEENGLGLPYPVVLINAAEEELDEKTGERVGISVPDLEGLVAALAVARALHPIQLHGSEVRFIRKALGMSARDMASALTLDPATFSRWENGKQPVGEWADKQVRTFAVLLLRDRVPGLSRELTDIVALKIRHWEEGDWPRIEMRRVHVPAEDHQERDAWDTMGLAIAA